MVVASMLCQMLCSLSRALEAGALCLQQSHLVPTNILHSCIHRTQPSDLTANCLTAFALLCVSHCLCSCPVWLQEFLERERRKQTEREEDKKKKAAAAAAAENSSAAVQA